MDPAHHNILAEILSWLIPGVLAIVFHEYAHGWVAGRLGDPTAREAGRLSLNPIRHIDPVGTLIVPGLMLLSHTPFLFGWAKPVPVNFRRLRGGRYAVICVALAGPLANLLMMFGWLALAALILGGGETPQTPPSPAMEMFAQVVVAGVAINLVLMLFNLVPIPPLDGGRVVSALLPDVLAQSYMRLEPFGTLILLVLIATGVFHRVFNPLLGFFFTRLGMM